MKFTLHHKAKQCSNHYISQKVSKFHAGKFLSKESLENFVQNGVGLHKIDAFYMLSQKCKHKGSWHQKWKEISNSLRNMFWDEHNSSKFIGKRKILSYSKTASIQLFESATKSSVSLITKNLVAIYIYRATQGRR